MVVNNLDCGGLEKVVLSLLGRLSLEGIDTSLICLSGPGELFEAAHLRPDRCLILDKLPDLDLAEKLRASLLIMRIRRFLRDQGVDVVHAHNAAPLVYGGLAAHTLGRARPAVIYSEHNQIYRADAGARRHFRRYIRLADVAVAVSDALRRTLVEDLHVSPIVRVLHNGIDPTAMAHADGSAIRRELAIRDGEFLVGTAAVLREQKGIPYLLEAARLVRAADPTVRFVIAGDGPLRSELEKTADTLQLHDTVRFLGYRGDIPQIVAALDAFVLPSLWEGLPLALLEAMAAGKPIVATRVGGNVEIVDDPETGFLVPPRDPESLARAVLTLRRDAEARQRMQIRSREKFARHFDVTSMTQAHAALYREVAEGRRR